MDGPALVIVGIAREYRPQRLDVLLEFRQSSRTQAQVKNRAVTAADAQERPAF